MKCYANDGEAVYVWTPVAKESPRVLVCGEHADKVVTGDLAVLPPVGRSKSKA